jgi:hypothetical protein
MMLQHGGPDRDDRACSLDRLAGHLDQTWIPLQGLRERSWR